MNILIYSYIQLSVHGLPDSAITERLNFTNEFHKRSG